MPKVFFREAASCADRRIKDIVAGKFIPKLRGRYITIAEMVEDCKKHLLPKLANIELKGVAGVPRSGVLPASVCAVFLNLPLYGFSTETGFSKLSGGSSLGGRRMEFHDEPEGKILLLDDTYFTGDSMKSVRSSIKRQDILYASLYVNPEKVKEVDIYGLKLQHPYFLEWCLFNSGYMSKAYLDFDGILCPNVPFDIANNEDKYIDYITNVEPYYENLPRIFKCQGIITARLEKYRGITEAWLEKYNVNYGELIMFPTEKKEERDQNHIEVIGEFKGRQLEACAASLYIESEPSEAREIKKYTRKMVICPRSGRFE